LEYLIQIDFTKEVDLAEMLEIEYELSPEEDSLTPTMSNLMKLIKIILF
jgi:hypothetical protein